jgi:hypothetical protein
MLAARQTDDFCKLTCDGLIFFDDEIQVWLKESPVNGRAHLRQKRFESNVSIQPGLRSPEETSSPEKIQQATHHL